MLGHSIHFKPIALRKAKIIYNFGLSESKRVKGVIWKIIPKLSLYPFLSGALCLVDCICKMDISLPKQSQKIF